MVVARRRATVTTPTTPRITQAPYRAGLADRGGGVYDTGTDLG